ncbi:SOS response-associated peptidase [Niveibacterium sp. 24ML]|uniref:SOS response-associated peptidase n=1 Tax=Niveibacterium sp. 24ML TaxID=2985512 RepID=UPI0022715495|nr:SOS response-associated peptidase family protein [Niveibacterium sp. 24ML]MCX9158042.1 SOS response-associated peptidase [Niveibacterium sp. 24ML]
MCADYNPARIQHLERLHLGSHTIAPPAFAFSETFPGGVAPFLANILSAEWLPGMFGMVPHWGDPAKLSRMTYNARAETVAEKPSFRAAWKNKQFGLIPAECFFEPNYESGKAVRWRIGRADGEPFMLAGIWERRMHDEGPAHWSFSMLTINADDHPLMHRFHKPGDEKRSVVVLDPDDHEGWLNARTEPEARSYLRLFEPELMTAGPAPLPPRRKPPA